MRIRKSLLAAAVTGLALMTTGVSAKVSEQEATRLDNELTPVGAERAGNADGTIPAWNPDFKPPANYVVGGKYVDPYPDDKPLFTITAKNAEQYRDKLTPGMLAMFKAYPDTFKMPVYPSRRDGSYSDYILESARKNATRSVLSEDQNNVLGAKGGTPFPIPQNAAEVVWNRMMNSSPVSFERETVEAIVYRDGSMLLGGSNTIQYAPYYDPNVSLEEFEDNDMPMLYRLVQSTAPTRNKGQSFLVHEYKERTGSARKAWSYTPGVRRVRRAPTIAFDTPQGLGNWRTTDESYGFNGSLEKYNWSLEGKKEIYIPYNNYKFENAEVPFEDLLPKGHANPDYMRYEMHRVWVVKAELKDSERNVYKTRVLYFDEDSWAVVATDQYDNRDTLWRTSLGLTVNTYDVQGIHSRTFFYHDLVSREYFADGLFNTVPASKNNQDPRALSFFSPATLRKLGVR
ncbi:MAG: DUF1329 domain-containing protein [Endozoicomonas sp.]